jgi:hypothetical protein
MAYADVPHATTKRKKQEILTEAERGFFRRGLIRGGICHLMQQNSSLGLHGYEGPPSLRRFTFKDAMPLPTSSTIAQANEDYFNLLRKDIKTQFERSGNGMRKPSERA